MNYYANTNGKINPQHHLKINYSISHQNKVPKEVDSLWEKQIKESNKMLIIS